MNPYFLSRLCVRVDPAADFAALEADGFLSVRLAADAALAPVSLEVFRCARADPAADFAVLVAVGLRSVFEADVAARFPVRSMFLAITIPFAQWISVFTT